MSLTNPNTVVTEKRLSEFYQGILPYLGGTAEAGFTPVGTVIAVMGNSAPANYLACNGQVANIADYPVLADYFEAQFGTKNHFGGDGVTTFAVPDLRGEFYTSRPTNTSVLYCIATHNIFMNPELQYSTQEQVVGTWIDGKPVYQKTVNCGAMPNNTSKNIAHGSSNIKLIIKVWGISSGAPLPYTYPHSTGDDWGVDLKADTTNIVIRTKTDWSTNNAYVTIQYTKTTD